VTHAKHRVDLVVGQRPVGRGYRAQHVGEQLDLVERDGIMEAIVEVISHRSTSVAIAVVQARGRLRSPRELAGRCHCKPPALGMLARVRVTAVLTHDPSGSFPSRSDEHPHPCGPRICDRHAGQPRSSAVMSPFSLMKQLKLG
jgi:hypothetical protein